MDREKTYRGVRADDESREVTVDGEPLDPRHDICDESPTGIEWGYSGSGPAQLAFALLADATGDITLARETYIPFMNKVVRGFRREGWKITSTKVRSLLEEILNPKKK